MGASLGSEWHRWKGCRGRNRRGGSTGKEDSWRGGGDKKREKKASEREPKMELVRVSKLKVSEKAKECKRGPDGPSL